MQTGEKLKILSLKNRKYTFSSQRREPTHPTLLTLNLGIKPYSTVNRGRQVPQQCTTIAPQQYAHHTKVQFLRIIQHPFAWNHIMKHTTALHLYWSSSLTCRCSCLQALQAKRVSTFPKGDLTPECTGGEVCQVMDTVSELSRKLACRCSVHKVISHV